MRRTPTPRNRDEASSRGFPLRVDLDAAPGGPGHGLRPAEPASFAPANETSRPAPRPPAAARHGTPDRDRAARMFLQLAEDAVDRARRRDERSLWSERAFDTAELIDEVLTAAAPRANVFGAPLRRITHAGQSHAKVVGDPCHLSQVLRTLMWAALQPGQTEAVWVADHARAQGHQMVLDVTVGLGREPAQVELLHDHAAGREIRIDADHSFIFPTSASQDHPHPAVTLRLRLPLARVEAEFTQARYPSVTDEAALQGLRILIVEDMDLNRDLLRLLLSPLGCELSEVTNGWDALAAVEAAPFDIILMDLQLPKMDGFEAIRRIRSRADERGATPILAVSGRAMAADIAKVCATGANSHLSKPYTSQDLVGAINHCRRQAALRA